MDTSLEHACVRLTFKLLLLFFFILTLSGLRAIAGYDDEPAVHAAVRHGVRALPPARLGPPHWFGERHAAVRARGPVVRVPGRSAAVRQRQRLHLPRQRQLAVRGPDVLPPLAGRVVRSVARRSVQIGRGCVVAHVAVHPHLGRRLVAAHFDHRAGCIK